MPKIEEKINFITATELLILIRENRVKTSEGLILEVIN